MMRLDKFFTECGTLTRSETARAVRGGRITVNGITAVSAAAKIDENTADVRLDGVSVGYKKFRYIMLNKPEGYVSTTDGDGRSVMTLLPPEMRRMNMFPCGRLDIDTTGLLIITNDGQSAHNLLSPKKHCEKTYRFECLPLDDGMKKKLESGVELKDFVSKPCRIELDDAEHGAITVTEGKYHQIKRMFLAVGSEITRLERISFAGIALDEKLSRGEWHELDEKETALLLSNAGQIGGN